MVTAEKLNLSDEDLQPVHLSNEQIIILIGSCFTSQFYYEPKMKGAEVKLYVRKSIDAETGIDFCFVMKPPADSKHFKGVFFGEGEFLVACGISNDCPFSRGKLGRFVFRAGKGYTPSFGRVQLF
ncbi:hypothetical protein [Puia dinghuensis]|uniref:Uncharacterized protein n=1 Tax=Puia dinghuensis TaxID=1792502 RepID=A0A8J2XST7_9BACT|nr:hypothetical protein [Puia dinghuensis]GGA93374.1 hypothetical protein GCM10011511_15970 [Puia dinghuensis]